MNFDKQLDVFSRNLSEIRRNGRYSYCCFANKLRKIFIQSAKKKRRLKGF